jgi:hypothetical protein
MLIAFDREFGRKGPDGGNLAPSRRCCVGIPSISRLGAWLLFCFCGPVSAALTQVCGSRRRGDGPDVPLYSSKIVIL